MYQHITIIGSTGAIGNALLQQLSQQYKQAIIHSCSQSQPKQAYPNVAHRQIQYNDESTITLAAEQIAKNGPLDLVIVATGILHDDNFRPEKSLKEISAEHMQTVLVANTILPALIMKHFLPMFTTQKHAVFAALSARVGSISDNRLGGWYAYRASKAALNMIIKNASIEMNRLNKQQIIVGLHPGTVDSKLSQPFQTRVPADKLFAPNYSAEQLLSVIDNLKPTDSGKCFAWDGQEILP